MKKILFILVFCVSVCHIFYAHGKNLHELADRKMVKVYVSDIKSETDKINPEMFRGILKETLANRKKENFVVVDNKSDSDITIDCDILSFKYSEKDPVDNVIGGTTALIVDALVPQNYAKAEFEFTVYRTKDNMKIWARKEGVSVTQTNMPEPDSIPKVLKEGSKRFIYLCFGNRRR